jgi:serralysin
MAVIDPDTSGAPTGNIYVDALIWGGSWKPDTAGEQVVLTWAPVTRAASDGTNFTGSAWQAHELAALRTALGTWAAVSNLTFVEKAAGTTGTDLDYAVITPAQGRVLGFAAGDLGQHEVPDGSSAEALTGVFQRSSTTFQAAGLVQGGYDFITLIHEIGHGLGLAHPHDGGGDNQRFPGVNGPDAMGRYQLNQGIWTTMSYIDGFSSRFPSHSDETYGYQGTPMALDIAAIQTLYGANMTTRTGADTYVLPSANAAGTFWSCIWDAGGVDAISAAGIDRAATIDLREAPLTGANAGGYVSSFAGIVGGFTIANGVVIENAVGGLRGDVITGNAAANRIDGGGGADTMTGGAGNDTYVVAQVGDRIVELAGGGTDAVESSVTWTLGANLEILRLGGNASIGGTGNSLNNLIGGNAAANLLSGGDGADTLAGGGGADRLTGGLGADSFLFDVAPAGRASADRVLDFTAGEDRLLLDDAVFLAAGGLGQLGATRFVLGVAAADADDRLLYNAATGWLLWDDDGAGGDLALDFAFIGAGKALTAAMVWVV